MIKMIKFITSKIKIKNCSITKITLKKIDSSIENSYF